MVIYDITTNYHLLSAIVHKINYNSYNDCVILIDSMILPNIKYFENIGRFFSNVIVYDSKLYFENDGSYSKYNDIYIEKLFYDNKITLNKCHQINVFGAQFKIGAYLVEHNIPFIFWEEASGLLSRSDVLCNNENTNPIKQKYCIDKGLYNGLNNNVIKRVCNINAQKKGFNDRLAVHFDLFDELSKCGSSNRKELLKIFTDINSIKTDINSVIFLTQHFANLSVLSFEEQALIYQLVVDYFFENKQIIFKPHPDDLMYYGILFPESKVIREKFPAEFLPFIFTNKPQIIATISSTGIFNIGKYFDECFIMDFEFQTHFNDIHRYFIAVKAAGVLGANYSNVRLIGTDEKLVENLFKYHVSEQAFNGCIYFIDRVSKSIEYDNDKIIKLAEELPENSAIIFINSNEDYCFHSIDKKGIWNYIVPICIKKKCIKTEEFYSNTDDEVIYFFSKSERLRDMMKNFEFSKDLKYTGINISVDKLTDEQQHIKVLEGILAATEERLLYYIQHSKNTDK